MSGICTICSASPESESDSKDNNNKGPKTRGRQRTIKYVHEPSYKCQHGTKEWQQIIAHVSCLPWCTECTKKTDDKYLFHIQTHHQIDQVFFSIQDVTKNNEAIVRSMCNLMICMKCYLPIRGDEEELAIKINTKCGHAYRYIHSSCCNACKRCILMQYVHEITL